MNTIDIGKQLYEYRTYSYKMWKEYKDNPTTENLIRWKVSVTMRKFMYRKFMSL